MLSVSWIVPGILGFGMGVVAQRLFARRAQDESDETGIEDFMYPAVDVGDVELAERIQHWTTGGQPDGKALLRTSSAPHPNLADELRDAILEKIGGGGAPPGPAAFLRTQFNSETRGVVDLGTLPRSFSSARTYVLTFVKDKPLRLREVWRQRDPKLRAVDPGAFARRFKILVSDPNGLAREKAAIQTVLRERGVREDELWV